MHSMRTNLAAALLLACMPLAAQDDPLKSPACGAALSQLEAGRAAGGAASVVETLRSAAAAACLGSGTTPSRPARVLRPPVGVPPPQIEPPQRVAPLPAPALPPPPVAIERPPAPATCDAGGCWTQDGTHLRHIPPPVAGPPGLCSQQGTVIHCP
jgi:hypothetical protein